LNAGGSILVNPSVRRDISAKDEYVEGDTILVDAGADGLAFESVHQ
jgi:hypothetical protein